MPIVDGKCKIVLNAVDFEAALSSIPDHSAAHEFGGTDVIALDKLGTTTDITDLDSSTTKHGLCPKGEGTGTKYLRDDITWGVPEGVGGVTFGTTAGTACEGNDVRLADNRYPTGHAASHKSDGIDAIKITELAVADNVTTLNATTSNPGLCPTGEGTGTKFLSDNIEWIEIAGGGGTVINSDAALGITIGTSGSGAAYECTGTSDHVKWGEAFAAADGGTTIYVLPGVYNWTGRVSCAGKSLNIIGLGKVTINKNVVAGTTNGLYLEGQIIVENLSVTETSVAGNNTIKVSNGAYVQAGDIIKLWKNVLYCPDDYDDQLTGEMYRVKSVSGNDITLTENLLRDYATGDTPKVNVYRPVEVNIENLRIFDADETGVHNGISIRYCVNSSISRCRVENAGLAGISVYSSYNVRLFNNYVYDSIKTAGGASGYGIGIWSGVAHAEIYSNHVENCRHCITMNTDERNSLIRGVSVHNNILTAAIVVTSCCVDAHNMCIDMDVVDNTMYLPVGSTVAFWDGTQYSTFRNNRIYGGNGAVERRGTIDGGVHIITDNYLYGGANSRLYKGAYWCIDEELFIENNYQNGGDYGIVFLDDEYHIEAFKQLVIRNNHISNISYDAIQIKLNQDHSNVVIEGNNIYNASWNGISVDANSFTPDSMVISNNTIIDCNYAYHSYSGILITDISNVIMQNNTIIDTGGFPGQAIKTAGTSNYNVIAGNTAKGMTGTKFLFAGANDIEANNTEL